MADASSERDGAEENSVEQDGENSKGRPSRERKRPAYLQDYVDVLGSRRKLSNLEVVKNRRKTKKTKAANEAISGRKSCKLLQRIANQLQQVWLQLRENHEEFEELCEDDDERQAADTWLLEAQEVVEELECRTMEYLEEKTAVSGSEYAPSTTEKGLKDNSENGSVSGRGSSVSKSESNRSAMSSASSKSRARIACREADLANMKLEQVKERAELAKQVAARKAELDLQKSHWDAQLTIKEAEHEAARKQEKARLLQEEIKVEERDEVERRSRVPRRSSKQIKPLGGIRKEDFFQEISPTEKVADWMMHLGAGRKSDSQPKISRVGPTGPKRSIISSLPKLSLPMFEGDPLQWPHWYGLFKALVHEQGLSDTEKIIYLQSSVKGAAERAVSGMLFDGSMYNQVIKELSNRFDDPGLISKALIRRFLEMPKLQDETPANLRPFVDTLHGLTRTLKTYGHDADLKAAANLEQVTSKLPMSVVERWSRHRLQLYPKQVDMKDLDDWLETEVRVKEMILDILDPTGKSDVKGKQSTKKNHAKKANPSVNAFTVSGTKPECALCQGEHTITSCGDWKGANVEERWALVKKRRLCFRCLGKYHKKGDCPFTDGCEVEGCGRRHHPQLHSIKKDAKQLDPSVTPFHPARSPEGTSRPETAPAVQLPTAVPTAYATCGAVCGTTLKKPSEKVALQIIPVILVGLNGHRMRANAFLDGGSCSSYIREEVADALGLEAEKVPLQVSVFGAKSILTESKTVSLSLESVDGRTAKEVLMWTTPKICEMRAVDWTRRKVGWEHLQGLDISKPIARGEVDVLIGSDYYEELLMPLENRRGKPGEPVGVRTPLGWTIVGRVPQSMKEEQVAAHAYVFHANTTHEMRADELMRRVWDDGLLETKAFAEKPSTAEEELAERKVKESRRYIDGRYEVAIPWTDDEPPLQSNRKSAEARLFSLEKHLKRRPAVAEKYKQVMEANLAKGYIRKLEPEEVDTGPEWYLPHFPVVREDKETTKVRIVYDSAARYGGVSLNDTMLSGPKLQQDIFDVLLRFRRNPVALVADLTEMFSQVVMAQKDRRYHRFLWRGLDLTRPPEVYEAMRLMFGDRASPYLAQYIVRQHAEDHEEELPLVVAIILLQMYMDDIMTSLNTDEEAIRTRDQLIELLGKAGFKIRRWCSNRAKVLEDVPVEDRVANVNIEESELPCMKALGVRWDAETDMFTFRLSPPTDVEYTKRGFLKRLATVFDPLQMLAPFTIRARMAMQETWLMGLGWDDEFPEDLKSRCQKWLRQLPDLTRVQIPRCYRVLGRKVVDTSIHRMTDASQLAYAAVSYVRHKYEGGEVTVRFVAAKAKVTPTKAVSIPRLELMGAVLGIRLSEKVSELLEVPLNACIFWTDSMDVICWIQGQSRRYKTFVANRISEIQQKLSPSQWRHVPTTLNCADDATRGLDASELNPGHRWFNGPEFLKKEPEEWPSRKRIKEAESSSKCQEEITRPKMSFVAGAEPFCMNPLRYTSWTKLLRVTAWVMRFIRNLVVKVKKEVTGSSLQRSGGKLLTPGELERAGKVWVRQAQAERFAEDAWNLKGSKEIAKRSPLKSLTPMIDEEGLLRVGGRLVRAYLPYDVKHPMILPKKHHITRLVIADVHNRCRHLE